MANTKRNNNKATLTGMPSRVKMINLDQAKISPAAKKLINAVDAELKLQAKMSNIPVLKLLGTKTLTAESFFLNHMDFAAIMGPNIDILDRMMMSAICKVLTEDILWSMDQAKVSYVGVWDNYTIYNILAAIVTFMKNDTTPEIYLTAQQYVQISTEDLAKLNPGSYMPYSEYNPNRFVEQLIIIRRVAIDTMAGIINAKLPKAFLSSDDQPLAIRLYNSYASMMKDDMLAAAGDKGILSYLAQPASEKKIRIFTDYFEKPFLTMVSLYLKESGLSDNIVNMTLGMSRVHIVYDDPTGKTLGDISINYTMISEGLPEGVEPIKVGFAVTISDAVLMACTDPNALSKSRKETFGKTLRTMILSMCSYGINIYTKLMEHNKKQNSDDDYATSGFVTTVPADDTEKEADSDDVKEMDIDDLNELLNP